MNIDSDPITNSAGIQQYAYPKPKNASPDPVQYENGKFGVDHDVLETLKSIKTAEKMKGSSWNPAKVVVPEIEFKLMETKQEVHTEASAKLAVKAKVN